MRRIINLNHAIVSCVVQNKKGARELLFDDVEEVVEGHATNSFWRQVRTHRLANLKAMILWS